MKLLIVTLASLLIGSTGCTVFGTSSGDTMEQMTDRAPSGDFAGLAEALAHERRADDRARDGERDPEAKIRLFDIQPIHTVAECDPGGGWYTRILAPYVASQGRYIAVGFAGAQTPFERIQKVHEGWDEKFTVAIGGMTGLPADQFSVYYARSLPEEGQGTVDRVLIPRMLHHLLRWNIAGGELRALRTLLADDGLVGVVQHRAGAETDTSTFNGYVPEEKVIALATAAGFKLEASSEINANPKDRANYEGGVWTLPPTLRNGDENRAEYLAIGESDRMTLRFRKP